MNKGTIRGRALGLPRFEPPLSSCKRCFAVAVRLLQDDPSHLSHLPVDQPFSFCAVQVTFRVSLVSRTNPVLLSSIGRLVI